MGYCEDILTKNQIGIRALSGPRIWSLNYGFPPLPDTFTVVKPTDVMKPKPVPATRPEHV